MPVVTSAHFHESDLGTAVIFTNRISKGTLSLSIDNEFEKKKLISLCFKICVRFKMRLSRVNSRRRYAYIWISAFTERILLAHMLNNTI